MARTTPKVPSDAQRKHANKISHRNADGTFKNPPGPDAKAGNAQPPAKGPKIAKPRDDEGV